MQSSRDKDLYYGNYDTMMIYDYLYSTATDSTVHVKFADERRSRYATIASNLGTSRRIVGRE
jgi:hypothetical protein